MAANINPRNGNGEEQKTLAHLVISRPLLVPATGIPALVAPSRVRRATVDWPQILSPMPSILRNARLLQMPSFLDYARCDSLPGSATCRGPTGMENVRVVYSCTASILPAPIILLSVTMAPWACVLLCASCSWETTREFFVFCRETSVSRQPGSSRSLKITSSIE